MKNKDQQFLEEAYNQVKKISYEEKSNAIKDLYDKIVPVAQALLADKKPYKTLLWEPTEEELKLFPAFSKFALRKTQSPKLGGGYTTNIEFGNFHGGQMWGPGSLSPYAAATMSNIERYTNILKVLQSKKITNKLPELKGIF